MFPMLCHFVWPCDSVLVLVGSTLGPSVGRSRMAKSDVGDREAFMATGNTEVPCLAQGRHSVKKL